MSLVRLKIKILGNGLKETVTLTAVDCRPLSVDKSLLLSDRKQYLFKHII